MLTKPFKTTIVFGAVVKALKYNLTGKFFNEISNRSVSSEILWNYEWNEIKIST